MILLLDNRDSFTYNIADLIGQIAPASDLKVRRSDTISVSEVRDLAPQLVVISPGPGAPRAAGISCSVIRELAGVVPIMGVCLGMQCIAEVFGGVIARVPKIVHGEVSDIMHDGSGLFRNVPSPFAATRYHSLAVSEQQLPRCLAVTARTLDGVVMGIRHRVLPVAGVQFHPESVLTDYGHQLIGNALLEVAA